MKASPIARRLLQLARQYGCCSQREAAKYFGITQPRLARLKSGSLQSIGIATARQVSRRTGCDLQWLLTGKHSHPTPRCIQRLTRIMSRSKKQAA